MCRYQLGIALRGGRNERRAGGGGGRHAGRKSVFVYRQNVISDRDSPMAGGSSEQRAGGGGESKR